MGSVSQCSDVTLEMVELQEMAAAEPPVWIPSPIWQVGEELDPG